MMRPFLFAALAAALSCGTIARAADDYPNKTIRFVTGFLPGGVSDTLARVVAEKMGERLGQRVIVDGRPGAGGVLSMEIAAGANPDGYTWYLGQPVITISPNFKRKPSFDTVAAFAPVSLIGTAPTLLVANVGLPFSDVKGLVAYAKGQAGGLRFGSSGPGTTNHMAGELLRVTAGIPLTSIPYKGAASTFVATISGEVHLTFTPLLAGIPQVRAGKLRAIGVTSAKRSSALPEVPAIGETLPGYEVSAWYGLVVPAKTPAAIIRRLNTELNAVLATADVRERLASQGVEVQGSTPEELARIIRVDAVRWAKLVKDAGLQLE
jgi:tripartite-type tricarboxylate transporter receptor subunit TctC